VIFSQLGYVSPHLTIDDIAVYRILKKVKLMASIALQAFTPNRALGRQLIFPS